MIGLLVYKIPSLDNRDDILATIAQLDLIIQQLLTTALTSVQQGNIAEYDLDTGQTRTRIKYTSPGSVLTAISDYRKLRQELVNQAQGTGVGVTRLMDEKNFRIR